jgi:hypothetical protein
MCNLASYIGVEWKLMLRSFTRELYTELTKDDGDDEQDMQQIKSFVAKKADELL